MARFETPRRQPRFDVDGVQGNFLFSMDIDVQNLSVSGMAIETRQALAVGRRYMFNLKIGEGTSRIFGRVAWCVLGCGRPDESGDISPVFHAGIEFENILTDEAEQLAKLIRKVAFLDTNNRLFGRFHLANRRAAALDSAVTFVIRRISKVGMLVQIKGSSHDFAIPDALVPLEFDLNGATVSAKCRIADVGGPTRDGVPYGHTCIGIEFLSMPPVSRRAIDAFIDSMIDEEQEH